MRPLSTILIACTFALAMVACTGGEPAADGDGRGTLTVAYANEEPYGYLGPDGRVTGEAPEILRVIAERLGYDEVDFVQTAWKGLIPGLRAKRFDVVAAGMYITPERAANVAFSMPTYRIGEAMLVPAGNPEGVDGYQSFVDDPDLTLGVVKGTVEVGYAEAAGIPDEQVRVFNDNASALAGVRAGQVDAFAGTALTIQVMIDKLGEGADVERAEPFTQPTGTDGEPVYGYGAFAFHPDNTALRDEFNAALRDYLGSEEHLALVEPFGFTEAEMTGSMTVDDVLGEQGDAADEADADGGAASP